MDKIKVSILFLLLIIIVIQAHAWQLEVITTDQIGIAGASSSNYGGYFICLDKTRPDLVIGGSSISFGDDCVLAADPTWPSSDLFLQANDDIILEIDKNFDGEPAKFEINNGANNTIYKMMDNGLATQTGTQAAIELKSTNNSNGSVLTLKNETSSLFNYIGAINFNNTSSTPGQIAYSSSNTLDFRVNNINPLMQLSNGANHIIMSNGAKLTNGGMWMDVSSRDKKNLESLVNSQNILTALTQLPIYQWRYKTEPNSLHMGPTAEEFYALFGLGPDTESLAPSDLAAAANVAIQMLYTENRSLKNNIADLKEEINSIRRDIRSTPEKRKRKRNKY